MTTTSQDLRVLLLSALCTCPKGAANGMTCGAWERIDEAMAVVQPELDRRDAENEQLRKERDDARATVRSILDDDLYESLHGAVEFQAARGERYRTAWWSARIRAAKAQGVAVSAVRLMNQAGAERDKFCKAFTDANANAQGLRDENEQLKATIDRAQTLATEALDAWKPEHGHCQERAARKGYSHDEAAAEIYGLAIDALTGIVAALDQPADSKEG